MRRNHARLTPTQAPSSPTSQSQSQSHSRNPSRADPLGSTPAAVDSLASKGAYKDPSQQQSLPSPRVTDPAPDRTHADSDARTLDDLRRRMEQTLINQQAQHLLATAKANPGRSLQPLLNVSSANPPSTQTYAESSNEARSPPVYARSNSSGTTVQGSAQVDKQSDSDHPPTPSYPFPLMPSSHFARPNSAKLSGGSKPRPTKAPGTISMAPPSTIAPSNPASMHPPGMQEIPDHPDYPSPNLYDVILTLNSAPGLDSWWTNVIDVLQTHFGVERASLAVPGDPTDLENVPWGQKATFNPFDTSEVDPLRPSGHETSSTETVMKADPTRQEEDSQDRSTHGASKNSSSKRPSLLARHSFAGFTKDKKVYAQRAAEKFSRDKASAEFLQKSSTDIRSSSNVTEPGTPASQVPTAEQINNPAVPQPGANISGHSSPIPVFTVPRDLETEADPLIKCTGILKLFGRSKPVVLTREYAYDPTTTLPSDVAATVPSPSETVQVTPATDPPQPQGADEFLKGDAKGTAPVSRHARPRSSTSHTLAPSTKKDTLHHPSIPLYEDYEQNPPSPWSQSPAPSPAPRIYPDQNPFFTTHAVDEEAFAKDPPPHDYSQAKFVNAIGLDRSKTIVHIPLLHATTTRDLSEEKLRFPMAVISFVSSVIPYPANLRTSILYLIPHLTTSYSLAHQYTQLERQLAPGSHKPRFGHILGLGGTFSDASSEMELVAGLSGQAITDGGSTSARASLCSPGEISNNSRDSFSIAGTPSMEPVSIGSASESSAMPGLRYGSDHNESYFTLQARGSTSSKNRGSKTKTGVSPSVPTSPGISRSRSIRDVESVLRDSPAAELHDNVRPNLTSPLTRTQSRNASTTSVIAQLQREGHSISEQVFQLMLNSVPLHLFLAKSQTGEVIWTNSKFDAYRRNPNQDLSIRDPWQNVHPNELESLSAKWSKALQTGAQFTERVQVKRFSDDSAYRWFIFRANPLLSQTGQVVSWIGSFLDIHEQHVAEMTAAQERETTATNAKYRALANSIPQVVFEATERRGLISANEQWQIYTGQSVQEAMNFGFIAHVHRDDLEKCGVLSSELVDTRATRPKDEDAILSPEFGGVAAPKVFAGGVTPALNELVNKGIVAAQTDENGRTFYTTELRLRSKGGEYRWHLVRLIKVETANFSKEEASWYGTCTDINDRKNLERELNRAMLKLNKEMESKSKFFSNMSHEIRTPLNGILGTIPFILDTQLDNEQRRMLDTIQNSSTNLRELVDNILDVSRVEAGKMTLVNSWFHVRSVVEDVIDTISSRAIDKGLEINYLMDTDVPAMVIGDRFRIRQVLINLMGNAVKFTSQGEIYTRCSMHRDPSISLKENELLLNFEVVDTGKGFSAIDAERLMQRFSQLGGTGSQQHAGSGLGLFLSKQLVEMHGGRLTPSSREGQGAKFSFYVKVDAPPHVQQDPALMRQPSDMSDTFILSSKGNHSQIPFATTHSDSRILTLQDLSPMNDPSSPAEISSSSLPSLQSLSNYRSTSSVSSAVHTPDFVGTEVPLKAGPSPLSADKPISTISDSLETIVPRSPMTGNVSTSRYTPPLIYSVLVLCPLDHAREAVKQHIEQVIPLEVPATITALSDLDDWKDLRDPNGPLNFSHIVLDFSGADETLEVLQYIQSLGTKYKPSVVIICDLYQKRQINQSINELVTAGFKVDTVPKPVKPSAFSSIFDPDSRRDLSKDRNQDKAREVNNNFKTMSKMVKEVIGNKGYRILLVEDDETNRMVMLKYLDKVKVVSETASNGQECVDMVFSHEPGYYSLIICDIQMPIKNGYETCREIRAWEARNHFPHIPIMALSANAMTDQIDDAARAGFNDYVTKPIKHNELGKMMMTLLDPNTPQTLLKDRKDWQQKTD